MILKSLDLERLLGYLPKDIQNNPNHIYISRSGKDYTIMQIVDGCGANNIYEVNNVTTPYIITDSEKEDRKETA